ncbi:MAG: glycosyltransferase family 39 protein [Candidatus Omnitrophota bacterium]
MKKFKSFFSKVDIKKLLIILFIIALIPPLFSFILQDHDLPLLADEIDYSQLATDILEGRGFYCETLRSGFIKMPHIRHPLYPFFISIIYFFSNNSIVVVKLAQILIHALTCLIILLIANRLFKNRIISFCSGMAWALYPLAISHALLLISETLFTFLLCTSILFILKYTQPGKVKNGFFSGLFLGLAILTKSFILLFMPILFLWFILVVKETISKKTMGFSILVFFMLLTISPWIIRNNIVLGKPFFIASGGGHSFYRYNNEMTLDVIDTPLRIAFPFTDEQKKKISSLSEQDVDKYLSGLGWQFMRSNPQDFFKIRLNELCNFWHLWPSSPNKFSEYYLKHKADENIKDVFLDRSLDGFINRFKSSYWLYFLKILYHAPYNVLFLGMFASLFLGLKKDRMVWKNSLLLFLLILFFNIIYIFHHGSDRYRLPIDPYVFMLGFYGITLFIRSLRENNDKSA